MENFEEVPTKICRVVGDAAKIRVREDRSIDSEEADVIPVGTELKVVHNVFNDNPEWTEVINEDNSRRGFILTKFLEEVK